MNEHEPPDDPLAAFYAASRPRVFRTVLLVSGNRDRALEATDEAFTRAVACWDRLRSHPNPRAWVLRTAINWYNKSWQRTWSRELLDGAIEESDVATGCLVAAAPAAAAADPDLIRAISRLPQRQREVVALRYLADLDPEEIAEVLSIASSTVGVHHHRAMEALRALLAEGEEGDE